MSPRHEQMHVVLKIFKANASLEKMTIPFIDLKNESIRWDQIFLQPLSSSHRVVTETAYGIWSDKPRLIAKFFSSAQKCDSSLKLAVLEAFSLRWGVADKLWAHQPMQSPVMH